jgi:hypothetical protein
MQAVITLGRYRNLIYIECSLELVHRLDAKTEVLTLKNNFLLKKVF